MGGGDSDPDDLITALNVVPLVDIVLVVLIIFMLTAKLIASQGIEVKLPKAATGESPEAASIGIVLDRQGALFLDGEAVTEVALLAALSERADRDAVQALISADEAVSHGAVIRLVDVIRRAGVTEFAFNIDPSVLAGASK